MKIVRTLLIAAMPMLFVGCDVDVSENAPATTPAPESDGIHVDVDTPAEDRMERREERRENIREAIDGVDVEVGDGGVDVDLDGE